MQRFPAAFSTVNRKPLHLKMQLFPAAFSTVNRIHFT
jgi:hypothetical protein